MIMTKEQQDLAWACLPKEARDKIKEIMTSSTEVLHAFATVFGNNLTSATEPEAMLMVERKKVVERARYLKAYPKEHSVNEVNARVTELLSFFGDKCLPYQKEWKDPCSGAMGTTPPAFKLDVKPNTPNTPNSGELKTEVAEGELNYKFSLGQKVILHFHGGEIGTISERLPPQEGNVWNCYKVRGLPHHLWRENELDAYEESRNLSQNIENCDKSEDNQLKDNMEEKESGKEDNFPTKELNLCEQLKGCEGATAYFIAFGEVFISDIKANWIEVKLHYGNDSPEFTFNSKGQWSIGRDSQAALYPSRALYEKYPLDPYSAWMEWKESRKPKRWRAEKGERYWVVDSVCNPVRYRETHAPFDDDCYEAGNYFRTEEEAQQAAEAVRETLEKFHKDHTEK